MSTRQWSLPARVYARPLELYAGLTLKAADLRRELQWLGYRASPEQSPGHFSVNETSVTLYTRGFSLGTESESAQLLKLSWNRDTLTRMQDENGDPVTLSRLEPLEIGALHPSRHEDRILVTSSNLPTGFIQTLTAVEDRRFYAHWGLSIKGILRALWVNLRSGEKRQGASTLTQQLVKNLFLGNEKTWKRKINEAFMALAMEYRYSKDTILETFVNEVFIAQDGDRAIHGFGLASQYFFAKPLSSLQPHQYALLIGMLKAPTSYNPIRHPVRALQRRNLVISLMQEHAVLTPEEADAARARTLDVNPAGSNNSGNPSYVDAVKRQLFAEYALEDLQTAGLRIFTNYDPLIQYSLEQSVEAVLGKLAKRFAGAQFDPQLLEVAAVVTDANTGEIKAMTGGRQPRFSGFNRALDASRPAGSLLKPAVYLSAWQQPEKYTLASLIPDTTVELEQPDGSLWMPENFTGEEYGDVSTLAALKSSLNLATVNLGLDLGIPRVIKTLQAMGISQPLPEIPSLLLGAHGFSVMDIAAMYQTVAADGFNVPQRTIREVQQASGETLQQYSIEVKRNISADSNYLLKYAMTETMLSGTGRSAYQYLPEGFTVAGKTGTSDAQRDSWFAGFSGDYLATVWVGTDQNLVTPLTGSSGALAIWSELMNHISSTPLDLIPPEGIEFVRIDALNGQQVGENCKNAIELPFIQGSAPQTGGKCSTGSSGLGNWLRSLLR